MFNYFWDTQNNNNNEDSNIIENSIKDFLKIYEPLKTTLKIYGNKYSFVPKKSNFMNNVICDNNDKKLEKELGYCIDTTSFENNEKYLIQEVTTTKKKGFLNIICSKKQMDETIEINEQELQEYLENLGKMIKENGKEYYVLANKYKKYGKYIALIFDDETIIKEMNETSVNYNFVNKENKNIVKYDVYLMDENLSSIDSYVLNPFNCDTILYKKIKWLWGNVSDFNNKNQSNKIRLELSDEAKEGLNMINVINPTKFKQ